MQAGAKSAISPSTVLVLAFGILFVDGYDMFTLGTVGPALLHYGDWQADGHTLGMLGSVTACGMPVGSVLAGWASDRRGRRLPLATAVATISGAMLLAWLAPTLTVFTMARALTGVGIGALAPLVAALVSDYAPRRRRALYIAVAMSAFGIGGAATALLGRALLPQTHFQWMFAPGVLPLLLLVPLWRLLPSAGQEPVHRDMQTAGRPRELFARGVRRTTVLLWVTSFMSLALVYSTGAWLPVTLLKSGYALSSALEFTMVFTLGASVGSVTLALIADRGHLRAVTLAGFLCAAAALLALTNHQPRPLLLLLAALAGVGSLATQGLVITCMAQAYPAALRGTGMGFGLGAGRFGAIVGPSYLAAMTGWLTSPHAGFYAFIIPAVLGAAAMTVLPRIRATATAAAAPATAAS